MPSSDFTYPPELLPTPDDGEGAEVIVVDPDTGRETVVAVVEGADEI